MELDPNFAEFIESLHAHDARFLIVGGYAVAFHGHPRFTADLDVWILIDEENAQSVLEALADFGFADAGLTVDDGSAVGHGCERATDLRAGARP